MKPHRAKAFVDAAPIGGPVVRGDHLAIRDWAEVNDLASDKVLARE
jgi:hypothetical protein